MPFWNGSTSSWNPKAPKPEARPAGTIPATNRLQMSPSPAIRFTEREWQLVYRVALKVLRTPDQAEDAAQDALLRAFRARARFAGRAKPDSWLYRIAFNTALAHLRRPFSRRYIGDDVNRVLDESGARACPNDCPEQTARANQLAGSLRVCMSDMRHEDRIAFTERFILGTSEKELGAILGVSANAAKQRAFRARRRLRSCLAEWEPLREGN